MSSFVTDARLLTAREVANLLYVSTETVLRWTRRGDLPGFRLPGGAMRYSKAAMRDWLAKMATPGEGASTTPADAAARLW